MIKKRIYKHILFTFSLIFFSLFLSLNVNAQVGTLSITSAVLYPGEEKTLDITVTNGVLTSDGDVTSSDTSCVIITNGSHFLKIDYQGNELKTVGQVTVKAVGSDCSSQLIISNASVGSTNGNDEDRHVTFKTGVMEVKQYNYLNNYLKSLDVSNATLSPAFNKRVTEYGTTVPNNVTSLNIDAPVEFNGAKVRIEGNSLNVGNNTVKVIVTSINGTERVYTINVIREDLFRRGDINKDGKINLTDVILSLRTYFSESYVEQADMNYDNKITLADVILCLRLYFSLN